MGPSRMNDRARSLLASLPELKDALPVFAVELARARRYDRPLSVISAPVLALDPEQVPLRVTDVAAKTTDGRVIALLIETDNDEADALAERVLRGDTRADVRTATFGKDALTLDDLLSAVE